MCDISYISRVFHSTAAFRHTRPFDSAQRHPRVGEISTLRDSSLLWSLLSVFGYLVPSCLRSPPTNGYAIVEVGAFINTGGGNQKWGLSLFEIS
jgi:hypothetical protein